MDRLKEVFSFFVAAMAMLSLLCAVYEAMSQRLASAGVLAAIFLASAFLLYVPYLETFKAFAVEVRLRQSLDRAEEIIGRLKELSVSSAKVSYMTIAWGNRMGTPSAKDKQAILDGVDAQLSALKVDSSERQKIAEPLVRLIGVDLYYIYHQVFVRFIIWKQAALAQRLSTAAAAEAQTTQKFAEEVAESRNDVAGNTPYQNLSKYDLSEYLKRAIPRKLLDANELAAADKFMAEVLALFDGCRAKGGFTSSAAEFLDKYIDIGGHDLKVKEVFGVDVTRNP